MAKTPSFLRQEGRYTVLRLALPGDAIVMGVLFLFALGVAVAGFLVPGVGAGGVILGVIIAIFMLALLVEILRLASSSVACATDHFQLRYGAARQEMKWEEVRHVVAKRVGLSLMELSFMNADGQVQAKFFFPIKSDAGATFFQTLRHEMPADATMENDERSFRRAPQNIALTLAAVGIAAVAWTVFERLGGRESRVQGLVGNFGLIAAAMGGIIGIQARQRRNLS